MTLQIKFEKANEKRLMQLIEWLREIGLVTSFKIETAAEKGESATDEYIQNLIEEGEQNVKNGEVYSTSEAKKLAEEWLKNQL